MRVPSTRRSNLEARCARAAVRATGKKVTCPLYDPKLLMTFSSMTRSFRRVAVDAVCSTDAASRNPGSTADESSP